MSHNLIAFGIAFGIGVITAVGALWHLAIGDWGAAMFSTAATFGWATFVQEFGPERFRDRFI